MKKFLCLLLVLVLAASLCACGSGSTDDPYGIVGGNDGEPEQGSSNNENAVDTEALWQRIEGLWINETNSNYVRFYQKGGDLRMEAGIIDGVPGDYIWADGALTDAQQNDHEYTLAVTFDAVADMPAYSYRVYLSDISFESGKLLVSDIVQQGAVCTFVYSEKSAAELEAEGASNADALYEMWQRVQGVWVTYVSYEGSYYFVQAGFDPYSGEPTFLTGIPFSGAMIGGTVTDAVNTEGDKWRINVFVPGRAPSEMDSGYDEMELSLNFDLSTLGADSFWSDNIMGDGMFANFYYVGASLDDITFEVLEALAAGN